MASSSPNPVPDAATLSAKYTALIASKTILVTGVSPTSIGSAFVQALASASPSLIILAGRNASKLSETAATVTDAHPSARVRTLQLDLSCLDAVRRSAEEVLSWHDVPAVDVLVNNAGVMATDFALSPQGTESQFAANHLAHFLFTNLIMPKVLKAKSPRIVMVASDGHRLSPIRWDDLNFDSGKTYDKWRAYGQSKTANMLFALSLSRKLATRGLQAYSVHPGVILGTGLAAHLDGSASGDFALLTELDKAQGNAEGWKGFDAISREQGAATLMYAALDPALGEEHNGGYLVPCRVADAFRDTVRPWAVSPFEAERLWDLSEKLVGNKFSY
ncbi:short-chain dehydrogenase [Purpureocillium lavendulum]|uniref:Short-chain dehydrogenase n=1 Tax=Purpureocillium lavendulum TaxID=1247861 RepID=A0AB34FH56_9HYPO|nr:short-chain dehydrogenase [Purpureocillium lavendulum]